MATIKENDLVIAATKIAKVPKGTPGTVVNVYDNGYEVEFIVKGKSFVETTTKNQVKKAEKSHFAAWSEAIKGIDLKKDRKNAAWDSINSEIEASKRGVESVEHHILTEIRIDRTKLAGNASCSTHMLTTAEFLAIAEQLFKEYKSISFVYNNNKGVSEKMTINLIIGF